MDREEARRYILARATDYLQPDNSGRGFVCPICGSGTGSKGTGITSKDGNKHFTCWAGCFTNSDVIDIIGQQYNIPKDDYNAKLQKAADIFHITIEGGYTGRSSAKEDFSTEWTEYQKQDIIEQLTQQELHNQSYTTQTTQQAEAEPDYMSFFLQASNNIEKTDYHRGLTLPTLRNFYIGFAPEWKHPKAPKMKPSPRLIIPTSRHSYLARYAGQGNYINYRGEVENKSKVGKIRIFNSNALWEAHKPVFVVEGELDALSIIDVGGEAIALGSVAYKNIFFKLIRERKPTQPLILSLDKDGVGAKATSEIADELDKLSIPFFKMDIAGEYKDANEALMKDRKTFTETIRKADSIEAETLKAEREEIKREAVSFSLQSFLTDIEKSKRAAYYPTGFGRIDALLDGGLYAGLYIVGAISSLGKTTFCLQIADQIAKRGQPVLVFSLEMAKNELIAKSVSRLTLIRDLAEYQSTAHAKTTRGILTGTRYAKYSQTERELIQWAIESYNQNEGRQLYITEGVGNVGIAEVREKVERYVKAGITPVVVIDYLQILAPTDMRATDKQNTDKAVLELKRLSRDNGIPVLAVSSFNRDNYTEPLSMRAFKESGAIEYSSDVLIGLQYDGMDYRDGEKDGERQKRIRKLIKDQERKGREGQAQDIQVKVLKNRNGSKGDTVLGFFPMFNYFTEPDEATQYGAGDWDETESNYNE